MNIPAILKNNDLQRHIEEFGFAVIDFADAQTISEITEYHEATQNNEQNGFKVGLDLEDKNLVESTTAFLKSKLESFANNTFENAKIFTASYVVKYPGEDIIVPPHQDWSFTDESAFASYTVWIPLVDANIENGGLCVIPGSHKFFDHPRSSPSPQSKSLIAPHIFTLFPYAKPIALKAGQAIVFDNRTIHASTPNISDKPRLAVGIGIVNKEAPLWHYYQSPQKAETLELYEVDEDFFIRYDNKTLGIRFDKSELLSELNHLKSIDRPAINLTGIEVESLVKSVTGNAWQDEIVAAVPMLQKTYASTIPSNSIVNKTQMATETPTTEKKEETKTEWVDNRTFFQKYTIPNIIAEIRWRLTGKA